MKRFDSNSLICCANAFKSSDCFIYYLGVLEVLAAQVWLVLGVPEVPEVLEGLNTKVKEFLSPQCNLEN